MPTPYASGSPMAPGSVRGQFGDFSGLEALGRGLGSVAQTTGQMAATDTHRRNEQVSRMASSSLGDAFTAYSVTALSPENIAKYDSDEALEGEIRGQTRNILTGNAAYKNLSVNGRAEDSDYVTQNFSGNVEVLVARAKAARQGLAHVNAVQEIMDKSGDALAAVDLTQQGATERVVGVMQGLAKTRELERNPSIQNSLDNQLLRLGVSALSRFSNDNKDDLSVGDTRGFLTIYHSVLKTLPGSLKASFTEHFQTELAQAERAAALSARTPRPVDIQNDLSTMANEADTPEKMWRVLARNETVPGSEENKATIERLVDQNLAFRNLQTKILDPDQFSNFLSTFGPEASSKLTPEGMVARLPEEARDTLALATSGEKAAFLAKCKTSAQQLHDMEMRGDILALWLSPEKRVNPTEADLAAAYEQAARAGVSSTSIECYVSGMKGFTDTLLTPGSGGSEAIAAFSTLVDNNSYRRGSLVSHLEASARAYPRMTSEEKKAADIELSVAPIMFLASNYPGGAPLYDKNPMARYFMSAQTESQLGAAADSVDLSGIRAQLATLIREDPDLSDLCNQWQAQTGLSAARSKLFESMVNFGSSAIDGNLSHTRDVEARFRTVKDFIQTCMITVGSSSEDSPIYGVISPGSEPLFSYSKASLTGSFSDYIYADKPLISDSEELDLILKKAALAVMNGGSSGAWDTSLIRTSEDGLGDSGKLASGAIPATGGAILSTLAQPFVWASSVVMDHPLRGKYGSINTPGNNYAQRLLGRMKSPLAGQTPLSEMDIGQDDLDRFVAENDSLRSYLSEMEIDTWMQLSKDQRTRSVQLLIANGDIVLKPINVRGVSYFTMFLRGRGSSRSFNSSGTAGESIVWSRPKKDASGRSYQTPALLVRVEDFLHFAVSADQQESRNLRMQASNYGKALQVGANLASYFHPLAWEAFSAATPQDADIGTRQGAVDARDAFLGGSDIRAQEESVGLSLTRPPVTTLIKYLPETN